VRKDQALALLELIADLYRVANEPDPEPAVTNGQQAKEPADATYGHQ
jgi:hypothetical protein